MSSVLQHPFQNDPRDAYAEPLRDQLAESLGVNLRTLVNLRWVATIGQSATLVIVYFAVGYQPSLLFAAAILAVTILATWLLDWSRVGGVSQYTVSETEAARFLGVDIVQLLMLLGVTGGIVNPFCVLILAPVTVSASVLSRKPTLALSVIAVVGITLISFVRLPLPWASEPITLPLYYTSAIWMGLVLGAVFMTLYIYQMADNVRRMNRAVAAAERDLSREQRLSAMGGLAAAAAHELGTPLATISVVAKEMVNDLPPGSPLTEDAQLLLEESARCREILTQLARDPHEDEGAPYTVLPVETLVRLAAEPYLRTEIAFDVIAEPEEFFDDDIDDAELDFTDLEFSQPLLPRDSELIKGLGNLIQNALEFAHTSVFVECRWTDEQLLINIIDDGPGVDPAIARRLGEPYIHGDRKNVSGKKSDGTERSSMGLGVFIAKSLLGHHGATVTFRRIKGSNPANLPLVTGTTVEVLFNRARLEG